MIRFFLLQNRQGKTRLSKWYVPPPEDQEKARLETEIHRLVVARDAKHTNFIEFRNYKLIYRRYAGLFFILGVDLTANELLGLETIHLFVELLDQQFANVCELDIVFNFNKVCAVYPSASSSYPSELTCVVCVLLGLLHAGRVHSRREVQETSKREMLDRIRELEKLE
ncbi:AP complex, mu/sigma subunit [Phytophthora cactorum]|nr:AP complex, mu/sigma subunit [Phytophthora cactorum]